MHKKLKNLNFNRMAEYASKAKEMLENDAIDWDVIVHYMGDDIREFLHGELEEPYSEEEFNEIIIITNDSTGGGNGQGAQ